MSVLLRPRMRDLQLYGCVGLAAGLLALSWAGTAEAQDSAPDGSTPSVTPPVLQSRAEAEYPPEALRARIEATVGLEIAIDETGRVTEARVTAPAGHGFDEAAIAAVKRFGFEPGRRNGVPLKSTIQISYEFHLPRPPPPPNPVTPKALPAGAAIRLVAPLPLQEGPNQSTLVLAPRVYTPSVQEPEHIAASDSSVDQAELQLRPRLRDAEGVIEAVPGLFGVQHAGGGKAQQYFMRGFDLDHGTDLAFFVDGLPVNAVSHAHGQGFSDLHFIIPEVIEAVESTKGPYSVRAGDFNTAATVTFHMADHLDESLARADVGQDGYLRAAVAESPDLGPDWRMVVAAEAFHTDGPFIHPDDYDRLNAYMKATRIIDSKSDVSLMLMGYGGSWNMSGVLPARAVCGEGDGTPVPAAYAGSHCLSRWDSIDPSQGGASQRFSLQTAYHRRFEGGGDMEAMTFVLHSNLQLFPNDGIASLLQPEGILYGSQIEQDDTRTESGGTLRITKALKVGGLDVHSTFGLQLRDDDIEVQLHRTEDRVRLDGMPGIPGPIVDGTINELELGAYFEEDWRVARWLRFVLGGRFDRIDAAVNNESPVAVDKVSGYVGAGQASPKATMVISPAKPFDLFVNYGRGFHTNDARTLIEGQATTLIATATGYEVGIAIRPFKGLSLSAVAFLLNLTSELTIDGDTASTRPSGPTQRYGGEFTARYNFGKVVYADAAFTVAHSRYTDAADIHTGQAYVTLAPVRTFNAGIGARRRFGPVTVYGSVHMKSMSDRAATQDNLLTATGFTLFDSELGFRWKRYELGADLLNIGNVDWREGQFAVNSRLPGEGQNPPVGVSFTPGIPRTFLSHCTIYW
jgi:TonB family protein